MPDPVEPKLPDSAPLELRAFIACKRSSVTIGNGPLNWLPLPPELQDLPVPDLTITPGPTAGTATLNVGFGMLSIDLPATITNGQLSVDSSGLPDVLSGAAQPIADWLRQLNDWLKHMGQQFAPPTVADGSVTLVKEPIRAPAATPAPATAPVATTGPMTATTPPPPSSPRPEGWGCLKWFGLLLGIVLAGGIGLLALNQLGIVGGPASSVIPTGSPVAAAPTQPEVPDPNMPPDLTPAPPATDVPTRPPVILPPTEAPPTQPDVPDPNMPPELPWGEPAVADLFEGMTSGLIDAPSNWALLSDPIGDQFTFGAGFAAPGQQQPWIDLVGAAGFLTTFDGRQARALSAAFPCSESVGSILVSCNQQMPMTAGLHVVVLTGWNAALPDPFPESANCSWAVQSDTDGDMTTGFPNPPDGHPLIGSDVYHETLMFISRTDDMLQNYSLASDYGAPPRGDTGSQYGNLPTVARALINTDASPSVPMAILFVMPHDDFGPFFSAHGYCIGDTADPDNTIAIDAIGHPADDGYPFFEDVRSAE